MAGSQALKENRDHSVVIGHAILGQGEPTIHLRCPRICRWWIYKCPAHEGSRGCIGNGPRRVAGGCSGCLGCVCCELVARDSFVPSLIKPRGVSSPPTGGSMRTHLLLQVGLTSTQSSIFLWTSHACNLNQTCSAHGARAVVHGGFISTPVCLGNMSKSANVH